MTRAIRASGVWLLALCAGAAWCDVEFFSQQRRGANCANSRVTREYWQAAADAGIEFIRLVPDSWESEARDFLIGMPTTSVGSTPATWRSSCACSMTRRRSASKSS